MPIRTKIGELILVVVLLMGSTAVGQNRKLGQTGFQFLSVTSDARAAAMGNAMTTVEAYSTSLFFNPAGMARVPNLLDARFSQNQWIADIMHSAFSLSFRPGNGEYGVIGLSSFGGLW